MEQNQNPESPGSSPSGPASAGPESSGLFYKDGREIPPTHPDHGPMHLLPRQEDGGIAAYYYCSKAELYDAEVGAPPPRRHRRDGFTPDRQEAFLEAVRGGASGREAARLVGISPTTAYNLYNSPDGAAFRAGWDEAARVTDIVLEDTAFERAVNGQEEAVYHKGEWVGTRRKHDNKLLMQLLRARMPLKYAPLSEIEGWLRHRGIAPPPDVDGALDRLRAAEADWGRLLPGEEAPRIAGPAEGGSAGESGSAASGGGSAQSVEASEVGLPPPCRPDPAIAAEPAAPETAAVASTSSTSSDCGQSGPRDSAPPPAGGSPIASTSSTSSRSGEDVAGPCAAAPPGRRRPKILRSSSTGRRRGRG